MNKRLPPTLNIIGGGKLGRSLGRLWSDAGLVKVQAILNRSLTSAQSAAEFIGSGTPYTNIDALVPADLTLIASSDDNISTLCTTLAAKNLFRASDFVIHCSGALSSQVLDAARASGAFAASVHPIRSFADPANVIENFSGTWCGSEGDPQALATIVPLFEQIGARIVMIQREHKTLYHAAAVFASNYLVTLADIAQQLYVASGISPKEALDMMEPLMRGTMESVLRVGPMQALTGPIARGDEVTVTKQSEALSNWDLHTAKVYDQLANATRALAARKRASIEESQ